MMEKQFVEMVKIAEDALARKYEIDCPYIPCPHLNNESVNCDTCVVLNALYDKGYRKQSDGEWIFNRGRCYGEPAYYCSNCSEGESEYGMDNFCHKCGARMKGGES